MPLALSIEDLGGQSRKPTAPPVSASRMAAPWQPKSEAETIGGERFVLRLPLIEEEAWERRAQREQAVLEAEQESCGHVPGQIAVARLDMIYAVSYRCGYSR